MANALTTTQPIGAGFVVQTANAGQIQFVADVGTAGGVLAVFGRTGMVIAQNGDYSSSQITNVSGVAGASVTDALNTVSALVSNTAAGRVPQTNGIAGQALIATATGSAWGTDFGAQTLTTTTGYVANSAANGFVRVGLAPGSGAGAAAAAGHIRGPNGGPGVGFRITGRNGADTVDVALLSWDSTGPSVALGGVGVTNCDLTALSAWRFRDTSGTTRHAFTPSAFIGRLTTLSIDSGTGTDSTWGYQSSGALTGFNWIFNGQTAVNVGGAININGGNADSVTSGTGGAVTVRGGVGIGAGATIGGAVALIGGEPNLGATRTGGDVVVRPGQATSADGNAHFMAAAAGFGNMQRGAFWGNARANPTANPVGGGFLYASAGGALWRGSAGTITTFAPP